jgi:hypothetical protein
MNKGVFSMNKNDSANDKIVYFGVININEKGKTIGAIDIWRSAITKELFCEEKRLGILEIADYIGMPKIDKGYKWAIAVNRNRLGKDRWKLIKILKEGKLTFVDTDDETIVKTNVKNYQIIDNEWWSFLVENNINQSIEITKEL